RGGVLTYFEPQTWTLLYPPSVGFYPNGCIMNNISARLLWQDPETLELHPWLATERPEISADATTYTFTIRDGVTYSDGSPLTPAPCWCQNRFRSPSAQRTSTTCASATTPPPPPPASSRPPRR